MLISEPVGALMGAESAAQRCLLQHWQGTCLPAALLLLFTLADIVNFAELTAHADTADCVLTLNQMYCTFDLVCEKYGVHKVDVIGDAYLAAVGHQKEDPATASPSTVRRVLECAREMLEVRSCREHAVGNGASFEADCAVVLLCADAVACLSLSALQS